ncbi:ChuX/HutX family heme-like substrate-binding protein [Sediminicoccus sp. KRV36]|uniref:hemin-degrading factor n=1 Tax=Sediminicoccus sp. KRV36 TaxID=3133721 RepID=UPI00200D29CC|nr:ChuX/HutX family heme-like substrate-binding protein [Sediminicoccus rosea]UPY38790.1 hemin-degrading factor [Sediminicoccus rosea]
MDLDTRYQALMQQEPRLRIRDAAVRLGSTEAALVALGGATPLRPEWPALFAAFPSLGGIMALTRNDHAVHERHGRFEEVSSGPGHILVTGPDIDLRLFPGRWAHAFALAGERPSLQIFDTDGHAVHKIFATAMTDRDAWASLVASFTTSVAAPVPQSAPPRALPPAEGEVDARALRSDWLGLRDTHEFFALLRRHKATRRQALRLAGEDLAQPLAPSAARIALELAAAREVPIMVFVGNRGAIQIHTGPVQRLAATPGWFNVLDPTFNLHLREAGVAEAWRVVKPTDDGAVTSLELLDAEGETIALLFGARKPGQAEREDWRSLVADVAEAQALEAAS